MGAWPWTSSATNRIFYKKIYTITASGSNRDKRAAKTRVVIYYKQLKHFKWGFHTVNKFI